MTSLAFGLGVLPLTVAHGAGSGAQNAIGVGVLGGMVTGTLLCVLFVPAFFVFVTRASNLFGPKHPAPEAPKGPEAEKAAGADEANVEPVKTGSVQA